MRRMAACGFIVGALTVGSVTVQAQDTPQPACKDSAAETQTEMNECAGKLLRWSASRLRALLTTLADSSRTGGLPPLEDVQKRWGEFRDAQCTWESDQYRGGTMEPMVHTLCLADLTERRIDELKGLLCGPGGGTCTASRVYDLKDDTQ